MNVSEQTPLSILSDEDLVREVQRLASVTRGTTATLVAHLAELEARRLHLAAGYPSLFVYCTEHLRLSEHEAYHRIEAARLARRFPVVLQRLVDGGLTLTTARLISSQMTPENHEVLLAAAEGKSKREVEALLARMFPLPDVRSSIRKIPAPAAIASTEGGAASPAISAGIVDLPAVGPVAVAVASVPDLPSAAIVERSPEDRPLTTWSAPAPARSCDVVRPLSADRYEIRFTASAATRERLQLASDLLRHAIPDGDVAEIVDRALTVLLEDLARKKFAATRRPASSSAQRQDSSRPNAHTRHVPAAVKRTVWVRDEARCAFVFRGGRKPRRCPERGFLEFHHVHPYADGGEATVGNIELRCRAHNGYEAGIFEGSRFATPGKRKRRRAASARGSCPVRDTSNSVRTESRHGPSLPSPDRAPA